MYINCIICIGLHVQYICLLFVSLRHCLHFIITTILHAYQCKLCTNQIAPRLQLMARKILWLPSGWSCQMGIPVLHALRLIIVIVFAFRLATATVQVGKQSLHINLVHSQSLPLNPASFHTPDTINLIYIYKHTQTHTHTHIYTHTLY